MLEKLLRVSQERRPPVPAADDPGDAGPVDHQPRSERDLAAVGGGSDQLALSSASSRWRPSSPCCSSPLEGRSRAIGNRATNVQPPSALLWSSTCRGASRRSSARSAARAPRPNCRRAPDPAGRSVRRRARGRPPDADAGVRDPNRDVAAVDGERHLDAASPGVYSIALCSRFVINCRRTRRRRPRPLRPRSRCSAARRPRRPSATPP